MKKKLKNKAVNSQLLVSSQGEVLIYGVVGDWWEGNDALTLVQEIESLEGDEITVRIHSEGGFYVEGLAVYNALLRSTKKVNIYIDGIALSMASAIVMAGDHVAMPENAWLMIHQPRNGVSGTADDMRKMADTLDGFEQDITKIYMRKFNGAEEEITAMLAEETWITAQEALDMGFIDEILAPMEAVAKLDLEGFEKAPKDALNKLFNAKHSKTAITATAKPGEKTMKVAEAKIRELGVVAKLSESEMTIVLNSNPESIEDAQAAILKVIGERAPEKKDDGVEAAVEAAVSAALDARNELDTEIKALCTQMKFSESQTGVILAQNLSTMDAAQKAVLKLVAERDASHQPASHVTVSHNTGTLKEDITAGLLVRAGMAEAKEGNDFAYMSLMDICKSVVQAHGVSLNGMKPSAIAAQAMHSTSDFPNILADVANKSLRMGYDAYPRTFIPFCRRANASDFKNINRIQLGEAPALEKVNEKGEFKHGTMGDGKESYKLETFGKIMAVTRQTIINDDLDALTRIPMSFGDAAADLENATVWGLITSNAKLSDNVAVFHANHNNLGSAGAPSETTLSEARQKMRVQKALNGTRNLNLNAAYALCPAALETTMQKLLSLVQPDQTSNVNVFANSMELIVEPLLDASSTTAWYTAASPTRIDTIEYAYLTGDEGVYIETRNGFEVDGVEIKARLDFGAGLIDFRGLFKNAGA